MKAIFFLKTYLICLLILAFSSEEATCKTSIVVLSEDTKEQELDSYIVRNQDKITYSEQMRSQDGALSVELITNLQPHLNNLPNKTRIEVEQIPNDQTLSNLLNGFLSPLRKKVLIELIKTKVTESTSKDDLLESLADRENSRGRTFLLPTHSFRTTDHFYINGERVRSEDLSALRLNPNLFYHFALISNQSQPVYAWTKAKDFVPRQRKFMAGGSCEKPVFNIDTPIEYLEILYPHYCITSLFSSASPGILTQELTHNESNWWDKNKTWALGGSLFILGTAIYEANRNYDIKVDIPF